jgi:transcriptional regulator with XRE-family HTH domain
MSTNYDRAMAQFEATLSPEERALGAAIAEDFNFAREIIVLRTALGISQSELAARTGVPQPEMSRIERGKTVPTVVRGQRILAGLGADFGIRRSAAPMYAAADSVPTAARAQHPKSR